MGGILITGTDQRESPSRHNIFQVVKHMFQGLKYIFQGLKYYFAAKVSKILKGLN
jgi:hypothetical protein